MIRDRRRNRIFVETGSPASRLSTGKLSGVYNSSHEMRAAAFQRRMSLLALAAMLLLALVPTLGRMVSAGPGSSAVGAWAQMCTLTGLKLVKLVPADAGPATSHPSGGGMPMQDDCPYCPILNALVALILCLVLWFPRAAVPLRLVFTTFLPRTRRHPCGLGSRGPPISL